MQLSRWHVAAFSLSAALLAGCIIEHPYVEPATSNVAYVNVTSVNGGMLAVSTFDEPENCTKRLGITKPDFGHASAVDAAGAQPYLRIESDRPISIASYVIYPGRVCFPIVNFTPQAGRYYRILIAREQDKCRMTLQSAESPASTNFRREGFRKMIISPAFDENSSFCTAGEYVSP
jgi:hypothetical protein